LVQTPLLPLRVWRQRFYLRWFVQNLSRISRFPLPCLQYHATDSDFFLSFVAFASSFFRQSLVSVLGSSDVAKRLFGGLLRWGFATFTGTNAVRQSPYVSRQMLVLGRVSMIRLDFIDKNRVG
jgi:hypothetical protein